MIAWVTGASSGLGFHIALALREAGYTVIAGARSFREEEMVGIHHLPLDVTDQASVEAFARAAQKVASGVDVVVHCAGILNLGSCEELTVEEYAAVMNTNFLGAVRMNQIVLPLMREKGQGRIVMLSSINGLMGVPFQSAYTAAKHALEGYAECLQQEVRGHGIQVCLVEPGDHRGGSAKYRAHAAAMGENSPYAATYQSTVEVIDCDEHHGSDPVKLARRVARLVGRKHMPFRKIIAKPDQHMAAKLHGLVPQRLLNRALTWYYFRHAGGDAAPKAAPDGKRK